LPGLSPQLQFGHPVRKDSPRRGRGLKQKVDGEEAVAAALQAFEDGLYLVILDGEEQAELDREVSLQPDSHVTCVRVVMLAGG
jgi:hypothetical protein